MADSGGRGGDCGEAVAEAPGEKAGGVVRPDALTPAPSGITFPLHLGEGQGEGKPTPQV
ncbi:protein of unknown function [Enterobacter cancerogenus]|nr:protein of unknown function [Enterobacter cancerogenus]